jgi:hypothetical protein
MSFSDFAPSTVSSVAVPKLLNDKFVDIKQTDQSYNYIFYTIITYIVITIVFYYVLLVIKPSFCDKTIVENNPPVVYISDTTSKQKCIMYANMFSIAIFIVVAYRNKS